MVKRIYYAMLALPILSMTIISTCASAQTTPGTVSTTPVYTPGEIWTTGESCFSCGSNIAENFRLPEDCTGAAAKYLRACVCDCKNTPWEAVLREIETRCWGGGLRIDRCVQFKNSSFKYDFSSISGP